MYGRARALNDALRCTEARQAYDEYAALVGATNPRDAEMARPTPATAAARIIGRGHSLSAASSTSAMKCTSTFSRQLGSSSSSTWTRAGLTRTSRRRPFASSRTSRASHSVSVAGITASPAPWRRKTGARRPASWPCGDAARRALASGVDLREELRRDRGDVPVEEGAQLRARVRGESGETRAGGVLVFPEPQAKRVRARGEVRGGEEVLDVMVDEDERSVRVGRHVRDRSVGTGDRVRREEARDAGEVVVRADGDDERDVGDEARVTGRDERETPREAHPHDADRSADALTKGVSGLADITRRCPLESGSRRARRSRGSAR